MRFVGERLGAPAATVSQIEKGQRALKEPKVEAWSRALEVDSSDLLELWNLCQGIVQDGEMTSFYGEQGDESAALPVQDELVSSVLAANPELADLYRLVYEIAACMSKLLPRDTFSVQPLRRDDPIPKFLSDEDAENARSQHFSPLPVLWVSWASTEASERVAGVVIPKIAPVAPIVRRRQSSLKARDLVEMLNGLNSLERERVRGYVEALIEARDR